MPDVHFTPSSQPVRFLAANQTVLAGGRRDLKATLIFRGVEEDTREPFDIALLLVCYDAAVRVDLLLSYD